jgi:CRP/FNR family transcriptional regulator, cyclic AMP receptor protein
VRAFDYERGAWRPGARDLAAAGLGRSRRFYKRQLVLTHGVPAQHAALITNGLVKVTLPRTSESEAASGDKTGLLLSIRGPGDLVGEETAILDEVSPTGAGYKAGRFMVTAITDGTARVFPADHLRRYLAEHPAALWPVAAGLCERLADDEERIASAARDNADRRLARLLCDLERYGIPARTYYLEPGAQITLGLSQAELPSWIGTCRETVDRTFTRWRRRGIISTHRRTIIVHDFETLARIAGIQVTRRALTQSPRGKTIA